MQRPNGERFSVYHYVAAKNTIAIASAVRFNWYYRF